MTYMKFHLQFFRSFLKQNAGKFKAEILLTSSHSFNVIGIILFLKHNWSALRLVTVCE